MQAAPSYDYSDIINGFGLDPKVEYGKAIAPHWSAVKSREFLDIKKVFKKAARKDKKKLAASLLKEKAKQFDRGLIGGKPPLAPIQEAVAGEPDEVHDLPSAPTPPSKRKSVTSSAARPASAVRKKRKKVADEEPVDTGPVRKIGGGRRARGLGGSDNRCVVCDKRWTSYRGIQPWGVCVACGKWCMSECDPRLGSEQSFDQYKCPKCVE